MDGDLFRDDSAKDCILISTVQTSIDERTILGDTTEGMKHAFWLLGGRTRAIARASMVAERVVKTGVKNRRQQTITVFANDTPIGEPPRVRQGFIKHFINAAFDVVDGLNGVIVGPEALANHATECLARLEYGDHPYMQPAFDAALRELPEIWQRAMN